MKVAAAWAVRALLVVLTPLFFVVRLLVDAFLDLDEWAAKTIDEWRHPVEG